MFIVFRLIVLSPDWSYTMKLLFRLDKFSNKTQSLGSILSDEVCSELVRGKHRMNISWGAPIRAKNLVEAQESSLLVSLESLSCHWHLEAFDYWLVEGITFCRGAVFIHPVQFLMTKNRLWIGHGNGKIRNGKLLPNFPGNFLSMQCK